MMSKKTPITFADLSDDDKQVIDCIVLTQWYIEVEASKASGMLGTLHPLDVTEARDRLAEGIDHKTSWLIENSSLQLALVEDARRIKAKIMSQDQGEAARLYAGVLEALTEIDRPSRQDFQPSQIVAEIIAKAKAPRNSNGHQR